MPVYKHESTKEFIRNHNLTPQAFNAHSSGGSHRDYVVNAAGRRELKVEQLGMGHYFYKDGKLVGGIRGMLSSLVSSVAVSLCSNKPLAKTMLHKVGVPVPRGEAFKVTDFDSAAEFFSTTTTPVVVKPASGSAGDGVSSGIQTYDHFAQAWNFATSQTDRNGSILVEEHVLGIDVRALVVGSRVIAASTRLPAYVVGDGRQTVQQLLDAKTALRNTNAYLRRMPIVVDDHWLENINQSLEAVPMAGEVIILNPTVNLHQGGENVDVTDQLCVELNDLAVQAASAIPGLGVVGVDLLVRSPATAEGAVVLELITRANISVHHLPAFGKSIDVGDAIVKQMLEQAELLESRNSSIWTRFKSTFRL